MSWESLPKGVQSLADAEIEYLEGQMNHLLSSYLRGFSDKTADEQKTASAVATTILFASLCKMMAFMGMSEDDAVELCSSKVRHGLETYRKLLKEVQCST